MALPTTGVRARPISSKKKKKKKKKEADAGKMGTSATCSTQAAKAAMAAMAAEEKKRREHDLTLLALAFENRPKVVTLRAPSLQAMQYWADGLYYKTLWLRAGCVHNLKVCGAEGNKGPKHLNIMKLR